MEKVVGQGLLTSGWFSTFINRQSQVEHTSLSHFGYEKTHRAPGSIERMQQITPGSTNLPRFEAGKTTPEIFGVLGELPHNGHGSRAREDPALISRRARSCATILSGFF